MVELIQIFIPWLILLSSLIVFLVLYRWAKKRKTGALVFMTLAQMVLPDPYAERTIKTVQEEKRQKRAQQKDGIPLDK